MNTEELIDMVEALLAGMPQPETDQEEVAIQLFEIILEMNRNIFKLENK